jgi:hypothetical protein
MLLLGQIYKQFKKIQLHEPICLSTFLFTYLDAQQLIAFASGVPFKQIQAHGTWTSESVWAYIHQSARSSVLPNFFRQAILSTTPTLCLGVNLK